MRQARFAALRGMGFTLIELMVAMVIGLVLTLAISSMVAKQEALRRGLTSSSDITSNSAFVSYTLDRELRSAGAGFSQAAAVNYGCPLNVSRGGAQLLPAPAAFPGAFAAVPTTYRLAPVVVYAGAGAGGSDVIAVATGASALSEAALPVLPKSTAAGLLRVPNSMGIRGGDLVLVAEAVRGCMLQQVSSGYVGGASQTLTFGGDYAADVVNGLALTSMSRSGNASLSVLGNVSGNQPRLMLFGIGANDTLFTYDLLRLDGRTAPQPLTDGVVDMRVLYGVDMKRTAVTRQVTQWIAPTDPNFTAATLTSGTPSSQADLQSVLAVRVGLILRGAQQDKDQVTPQTLTLFSSLGAGSTYTYTVPADNRRMRYRTVEFTVPLRNIRWSR